MMAEIKHLLVIQAPAKKVYQAITEEEGLGSWWTEEVYAKPEVNSIAEFIFGDAYHDKMKIINLESNKKLEWECFQGDKEWIGTNILFELEENSNKTTLRFTHGNWKKVTDFYANCNYHWGCYMTSLKNYCETGKGQPFKKS
jgi:uncharacterized protein YndB with AHSA1/START domain